MTGPGANLAPGDATRCDDSEAGPVIELWSLRAKRVLPVVKDAVRIGLGCRVDEPDMCQTGDVRAPRRRC
jgi:hypothetical protein